MPGGSDDVLRSAIRLNIRKGDKPEDLGDFAQEEAALWERVQNGGLLQYGHRIEVRAAVPADEPQSNQPNLVLADTGTGPCFNVYIQGTGWVEMTTTGLPGPHVLATNAALGGQHTITGGVAGYVLRASAAGAANFQALNFTDLAGTIADAQVPASAVTQHEGAINHNALLNLAVGDVHTHYALLAGRAGGQTLIGGTATGENLTLQSTAHATRGYVVVSDQLDVNNFASIGNANTPSSTQMLAIGYAFDGVAADRYGTLSGISVQSAASTGAAHGAYYSADVRTASGTHTGILAGCTGRVLVSGVNGGGTVTTAECFRAEANLTSTATITNRYGYHVVEASVTASTLTNQYGLYIDSLTAGATLNYAIYTGAGYVRIGDNTSIGTNTLSSQRLRVQWSPDLDVGFAATGIACALDSSLAGDPGGADRRTVFNASLTASVDNGTTQSGPLHLFRGTMNLGGTGTTSDATGYFFESAIGASTLVTDLTGFHYKKPINSGTLQNEYAFFCEDVEEGAALNYCWYSGLGEMRLGGNLTFNNAAGQGLAYGSLYLHEGAVGIGINAVGQGVYVKITGLSAGEMNNTSENSDAFNVAVTGRYKVSWSISGDSDGINKDYHCDIFLNNVEQGDGSARQVWGGAHDLSNMSGSAIIDITNVAHDLDLRMKEEGAGAGTDINLYHVTFNIVQVGGT